MLSNKVYQKLDNMSNAAVSNFYIELNRGKDTFVNFNLRDERHLALLYLMKISTKLFEKVVWLKVNWLTFLYLKIRYELSKSFKRGAHNGEIDCEEFVRYIEDANEFEGAFAIIYNEYYKHKKGKKS